MKKLYYYIPIVLIFSLLFSTTVNATTSNVSTTATTYDSDTLTIVGKTFSGESYTSGNQTELGYDYTWSINQNFEIQGLTRNNYYSGSLSFTVSVSTQYTTTKEQPILTNTYVAEGLHVFIDAGVGSTYKVIVIFDNYVPTSVYCGLPTITQNIILNTVDPPSYPQTMNINYSLSEGTAGNLRKSQTPFTNGAAGAITSSIDNSTALSVIAGWLYDIKTQDYSYYQNLLNQLSTIEGIETLIKNYTNQINTLVSTISTNVATILNDLETYMDFMEDFIPYLSNISTNTLNTYNQLKTILTYMKDRPSFKINQKDGIFYNETGNTGYIRTSSLGTNVRYEIKKEYNIQYCRLRVVDGFSWAGTIYYFENYNPNSQINTFTRKITITGLETYTYYPIDFKYNETFAIVNMYGPNVNEVAFYIGDGYTYQALLYYIENMIKMNPEQESEAAKQSSEYAERDNQSQQLINGMGSVTMPSLAAGDLDILSGIDTTQKLNFFGLIALITHNELITKIMLVIVMGAIVGWILYGKK